MTGGSQSLWESRTLPTFNEKAPSNRGFFFYNLFMVENDDNFDWSTEQYNRLIKKRIKLFNEMGDVKDELDRLQELIDKDGGVSNEISSRDKAKKEYLQIKDRFDFIDRKIKNYRFYKTWGE